MKLRPECIPCFFKQATIVANTQGTDDSGKIRLLKGVSKILSERIDETLTPARLASDVHSFINDFLGVADPFAVSKKMSNDKMLGFYQDFIALMKKSKDALKTAVTLSIIGNLIDYSLFEKVDLDDIKERVNSFDPGVFDYAEFRAEATRASRIVFIVDNAGEIVMDRPLIELLIKKGKKVIVAAKKKPILNDATIDDVKYAGIAKLTKVVGIGNGDVGTPYPSENDFFNKAFKTADMIISKGQANFETLYGFGYPVYFLFVAKCGAVANFLGVKESSPLLIKGKR
jgi:uncharacterized protein with ATP-grasp and redox domains